MFGFNPVEKPQHARRQPKRANRTKFSSETRKDIIERERGLCARCNALGEHVHHIAFRSELTEDVSSKRNGVLVCHSCHSWAHSGKEGRQWFLNWKENNLDEDGNYILPFTDIEG